MPRGRGVIGGMLADRSSAVRAEVEQAGDAPRAGLAERNLPLDPARIGGFAAVAFALPICSFNVAALAATM